MCVSHIETTNHHNNHTHSYQLDLIRQRNIWTDYDFTVFTWPQEFFKEITQITPPSHKQTL